MKGIEKITIQNFKAFREAETFSFNGKHVLVYGPNGSGKSSLYFALYTLFQSEAKRLSDIKKYFDWKSEENLLNVHERKNKKSFIELVLKNNSSKKYSLSKGGLKPAAPRNRKDLGEMNLASEFVSHRLLLNFYNFRNSEEIDLYPVFYKDILPFVFLEGKRTLFSDKIKEIELLGAEGVGLQRSIKFKRWRSQIADLDEELNRLIIFIDKRATKFLHQNFEKYDLKIVLKLKKGFSFRRTGKTNKYELLTPFIKLTIQKKLSNGKYKSIDRPQSFLNEGKLTAIALSIRFTLLEKRPSKPELKIMAFDDLLISLDMENRMSVLHLIFKLYEKDYQLFFFTHDWGFYEEVKRSTETNTKKWMYLEFNEIQENEKPSFKDGKTLIEKAKRYFEENDYNACALALRKLGETIVENFLNRKMSMIFDKKDFVSFAQKLHEAKKLIDKENYKKFIDLFCENDFSDPVLRKISDENFTAVMKDKTIDGHMKSKLFATRRALFDLLFSLNKDNMSALKIIEEVTKLKDRILNLGAHPHTTTIYRKEIEDGIKLIGRLEKVLSKIS